MAGNLTMPADAWLKEQFEFEYCPECGGDGRHHVASGVLGNWFAWCKHPIPDTLEDFDAEIRRRIERIEAGLPIVEEPSLPPSPGAPA